MSAPIERTPEGVLSFWLGPLRDVRATSEDNWRERMLLWRVGVFARGFEDPAFSAAQREFCEALHREGAARVFAPKETWDTPHGWLAKLIVLDQFPRCVYRGTPVAYTGDTDTVPMLRHICAQGWDLTAYNLLERMWVYVPLSHPEDRALQELSVEKWMQWSRDLVAASPAAHRRVNQRVAWNFVKAIIEHGEAVLLYGKFPHRNAILCRPHRAGEVHYLTSEVRPMWSFTQPPRPDYHALHAALHASDRRLDCRSIERGELAAFHRVLGLDPDSRERSFMDVFEARGVERVDFRDLYRHLMQRDRAVLFDALVHGPALAPHLERVTRAIFRDDAAEWPPKNPRASVPRVIDVPALNLAIGCPLLDRGDVSVPRAAIDAFVAKTGFEPRPFEDLFVRYREVVAGATASYEVTRDGLDRSVAIDRRAFERIAGALFPPSAARDAALATLHDLLDLDYDGTVEAREVLIALMALSSGDATEKLRACHEAFGRDAEGFLDERALRELVQTTLLRGFHVVEALFRDYMPEGSRETTELVVLFSLADFSAIERAARRALAEADTDEDGRVGEPEFVAWAARHRLFAQLLALPDRLFGTGVSASRSVAQPEPEPDGRATVVYTGALTPPRVRS
jgi:uncharacterized protein (DUF924 family)/Ca2+-binding EF-hand superfamily protein